MSANAVPRFTRNGRVDSVLVTAANTSSQGGGTIGSDIFKAFTADPTEGSYVYAIKINATATVANTATGATVARVFISSVASGATTSANTWLVGEITLASVTADSSTAQAPYQEVQMEFAVPASYTVLITNHAAPAANTAWRFTVFAGDY